MQRSGAFAGNIRETIPAKGTLQTGARQVLLFFIHQQRAHPKTALPPP
ncbi:MAG: hypothetical protein JNJ90_15155 [Saprospiraceae bacterium]|nr:hypothetical protein [Saprospiraceae bacterium]